MSAALRVVERDGVDKNKALDAALSQIERAFGKGSVMKLGQRPASTEAEVISTGSLGHGLPFGCGRALAAKRRKLGWRVFVMLSDGEMDEGTNWESILFAPQHRLDNLTVIVDYNKVQSLGAVSDVLELEPLADKFRAFRWAVREVDGHDHQAVRDALKSQPWEPGRPSCLIAHTVKGKGVPFMENQLLWHYRNPNDAQLADAIRGLETAK